MLKESNYRAIQITTEAYQMLKKYCDKKNLKMGKTLSKLIEENYNKESNKKIIVCGN